MYVSINIIAEVPDKRQQQKVHNNPNEMVSSLKDYIKYQINTKHLNIETTQIDFYDTNTLSDTINLIENNKNQNNKKVIL